MGAMHSRRVKGTKYDRRSTSGYFTFVGGNLVTWRSKKQHKMRDTFVARSSAETDFRGMTHSVYVNFCGLKMCYQICALNQIKL